MKRWLFIGTLMFIAIFSAGDLFSATYDLTGTWNHTISNNFAIGDIGCVPAADTSGTCTIEQTGDTFTLTFISGVVCDPPDACIFDGKVDGEVYTSVSIYPVDEEGGFVAALLRFTASSATSASGSGAYEYSHPSGEWECMWGNQMALAQSEDPGDPEWVTVSGIVRYEGNPVCAMVLANGQHTFTCEEGDHFGKYRLNVPLDLNGKITIQAFVSGLAPFFTTTGPSALEIDIDMQPFSPENRSPAVTTETTSDSSAPVGWTRITGTVDLDGTPLCAMVLANGQHMFSCDDNLGVYDLTVPLDGHGQITLFVFVSGFQPYQVTFAP